MIRKAVAGDLPAVVAVEEAGFPQGQRWSADSWAAEMAGEDRLVLVAVEDDRLLGVASFRVAGEIADLLRVVVAPAGRRSGVARRLVSDGMAWAEDVGAERMLLEVRLDNVAAQALYNEFGFDPLSRRRDYYAPGVDAVVMGVSL